jgi:uncharacterized NAD-dependent epimerase/dehydratase family protein
MQYNHSNKTAIFFDNGVVSPDNKMGLSYINYHSDKVVCIIDVSAIKQNLHDYYTHLPDIDIVTSLNAAIARGIDTVIIADMPNGGKLTDPLKSQIDQMVSAGLTIVNGLHDHLAGLYPNLKQHQKIYDLRKVEKKYLAKPQYKAHKLNNKRVLLVGSDMAVGKMTAGLQLYKAAMDKGLFTNFLATGQVGIAISGNGIPLDAIPLDFTGGAIEKLVTENIADVSFIEGQGSLNNPGSAATLPLMRGSQPTHLVFCHRTSLQGYLKNYRDVAIPNINELIAFNEQVAEACGTFIRPKTIGICVNTLGLNETEAENYLDQLSQETNKIAIDPIRSPQDCDKLLSEL